MSRLHFKYGAMNSGKSTALINTAYNYRENGLAVATTKPSTDTKGEMLIVARAGLELEVDFLSTPETNIRETVRRMGEAEVHIDCLLVDEVQFLDPKQIDQLHELAELDNTSVIGFGLRTDFRREMFPGSKRLLELATDIVKLPTMCRCGSQAEFNTRRENGKFVFEGDQVAIDGEGDVTYSSLCGKCYLNEMQQA